MPKHFSAKFEIFSTASELFSTPSAVCLRHWFEYFMEIHQIIPARSAASEM